ncbi:MAG TPA: GTP 3',8-cyclase MoaA [Thiotrichaceae bacterium]|nr:GTP 3',8-cyclase MoaA [Thiotrichaceae bacterium]
MLSQDKQRLIDNFGREIKYVRLSVTDKCNMRCFYCMPKGMKDFETPENWLTFDEIERIIAAFSQLGVSRVRLTGGEPLVRKNLPDLISRLSALEGIDDLSLSTNASLLSRYAKDIKEAGINRINVSLDTLKADQFKEITGNGRLSEVLAGLQAAKEVGLTPVKINTVAMKGVNDDQFINLVNYCAEMDFTLRFIETMPIGSTGRDATNNYLDLKNVITDLKKQFNLIPGIMAGGGPAKYYRVRNTDLHIGFITPISQHFCESCNRVRLSVDGSLYLCLGDKHKFELRPLLRAGITDEDLETAIITAINLKPEKHIFNENPDQVVRFMSMTGG